MSPNNFDKHRLFQFEWSAILESRGDQFKMWQGIESTEHLYNRWLTWIEKQPSKPNCSLDEVLPILLYKSAYRGNFYSCLANVDLGVELFEMQSYFRRGLSESLKKMKSYEGQVFHHFDRRYLPDRESLLEEFRRQNGQNVVFRKFISCSKIFGWDCDLALAIVPLKTGSLGKDVANLLYEESALGEQEVLFDMNSTFLINGFENIEGVDVIHLLEVDSSVQLEPMTEFSMGSLRHLPISY